MRAGLPRPLPPPGRIELPGIRLQLMNGFHLGPKRYCSDSIAACCCCVRLPLAASPEAMENMTTKNDMMMVIMSA